MSRLSALGRLHALRLTLGVQAAADKAADSLRLLSDAPLEAEILNLPRKVARQRDEFSDGGVRVDCHSADIARFAGYCNAGATVLSPSQGISR